MNTAVCLYVPDESGFILGVTRKGSFTEWGMPGGKVEDQESEIEAVCRETLEETGVKIDPEFLRPVYQDVSAGDQNFLVKVYKYYRVRDFKGKLIPEPGTKVGFIEPSLLLNGPFKEFYKDFLPAMILI